MHAKSIPAKHDKARTLAAAVDAQMERFQRHYAEHAQGRCMVLFDPSTRDARDDMGADIAERCAALAISHPQFPKKHRPYLLPLDLAHYNDSELLRASVHMALEDRDSAVIGRSQGQRVGGWLASSASAADTARHLTRHAMQGEGRKLPFRFYDMRCMHWLWPLLRPAQQRTLFGPITSWHILDAAHQWLPLTPPMDAEPGDALALDTAQWISLARVGGTNRALACYQHETDAAPTEDQLAIAWSAAGRAMQLAVNDPDDMAAFVLNALQRHPRFDCHPTIHAALAQRPPGQSGRAALADLDEAAIPRFVEELNQTAKQGEL